MYSEKYQWVRGEKTGNVEMYASHDSEWVYFQSGNRINANLIQDYMIQYYGEENGFDVEPQKHQFQKQAASKSQPVQDVPVKINDPVKSLLKQSIKNEASFTYNLSLSIPKKVTYQLIKDSFECDIDEIIKDIVFENIDKNTLYKELQDYIKEQITIYYNNGATRETGVE
jgi:hypothetical protein